MTVKAGHTLTAVAEKTATCTEDGNVAHNHCSACGKNFDAAGKEIADVTVKAGHTLTRVEAKAATTEADGNIAHYVCSACGKLYADAEGKTELAAADVVIEKLADTTDNPQTADSALLTLPVLAILVSLMAVAAVVAVEKKRN